MLQTSRCVTADCDQCGQQCWNHFEFPPHWPAAAAALAYLAGDGWRVSGPRLLCARCAVLAVCQAHGHEFSSWRECWCGQGIAAHVVGTDAVCTWQWRSCARCEHVQERPAPVGHGPGPAGGAV